MRKLQDKGCYTSEDKLPTKDEISVPAKQLTCEEEQCGPPLGMPNYLCPDGETIAGPGDCIKMQPVNVTGRLLSVQKLVGI